MLVWSGRIGNELCMRWIAGRYDSLMWVAEAPHMGASLSHYPRKYFFFSSVLWKKSPIHSLKEVGLALQLFRVESENWKCLSRANTSLRSYATTLRSPVKGAIIFAYNLINVIKVPTVIKKNDACTFKLKTLGSLFLLDLSIFFFFKVKLIGFYYYSFLPFYGLWCVFGWPMRKPKMQ